MLELGDQDLVARLEERHAPGIRDEIDCLGRAADEDDFVGRRGVEEAPDGFARALVAVGRTRRQTINAAMHVGVIAAVEFGDAVDYGRWLLRRSGTVEEHEARIALEDREVALDACRIERVFRSLDLCRARERRRIVWQWAELRRVAHCPSPAASQRATWRPRCARIAVSSSMRSITSAANASTNIRRASAAGMPRLSR